jgi:hypothetical protein
VGFVDSVDGISSLARPTSEALPCFDVEVCMLGCCCSVRVEFGGVRGEFFGEEVVPSTRHDKLDFGCFGTFGTDVGLI